MQDPQNLLDLQEGTQSLIDDGFDYGKQRFVEGFVPDNQTLVDPNRQRNARDIFAESILEEMNERRTYSEEAEKEQEEGLAEDQEGFGESENYEEEEAKKLAADYYKKNYGVEEGDLDKVHEQIKKEKGGEEE
jgi:hypothetical protein